MPRVHIALVLLAAACSPPPHVLLTIRDPRSVASEAATLYAGTEKLARVELSRPLSFPIQIAVSADSPGERLLRVEASRSDGTPLGRASTTIDLRRVGTPTAVVDLAAACSVDVECEDETYCDGTGVCRDGQCFEVDPCGATFACVVIECIEAERRCEISVNHAVCNAGLPPDQWGSYCNTSVGCVDGSPCLIDGDCDDADPCNGDERCADFRCIPGTPLPLSDGDPCTADGCDAVRVASGLDPVFHVIDARLDGTRCVLAGGGDGICRADQGACSLSSCGDGILDVAVTGELCDDGPANSDDWAPDPHCNATCSAVAAFCGDGIIDPVETCDDGGANGDAWAADGRCRADCSGQGPRCGDGVVDTGFEACDEAANNDDAWSAAAHCNATCTGLAPHCGDGTVDSGFEACDSGVANGDSWTITCHCNASCTAVAPCCGDGTVTSGEECDDGDAIDGGNGCNALCQRNDLCGDGTVQSLYEACDDGNQDNCTGDCAADCSRPVSVFGCGDGFICGSESCDDGNLLHCDTCSRTCDGPGPAPVCGDGVLCIGVEACDDGYTDACGTCNADCTGAGQTSTCGDSETCPEQEACEDGNIVSEGEGYCAGDCSGVQVCGDGFPNGTEVCDDGNLLDTDLCAPDCAHLVVEVAERSGSDDYGDRVAFDGASLVVGFPYGSVGHAWVLSRDQGGSDNWGEVARLEPSDAGTWENFGWSVAIDGDVAVVGAYHHRHAGVTSGAAYVYVRDQGGTDNWGEAAELLATDRATDDDFGWSVAVSGDTIVVGAANKSAAYVFARDQGGLGIWGEVTRLAPTGFGYFGASVAIDGDTAAVGAHYDSTVGAAFLFQRDQGGANSWGQIRKVVASDGAANDAFGYSLDLDAGTLVVGAPAPSRLRVSAAHVFARDLGGPDNWGEVTKLLASDGTAGDEFATAVAIAGDLVVVGAPRVDDRGTDAGAVYAFLRDQGGPDAWGQIAKLEPPALEAASDTLGASVAAVGRRFVAGSRGNYVGVYEVVP